MGSLNVFKTICDLIKVAPLESYAKVRSRLTSCIDQVDPTYKPPIIWLWGGPGCGKSLTSSGLAKTFQGQYHNAKIRAWDTHYDAIMNNSQCGKTSGHQLFSVLLVDEMGKDEQSHCNEVKLIHILGDSSVWTPDCKVAKNQGKTVKIGLIVITSNIHPSTRSGFNDGSVIRRMFIVEQKFGPKGPIFKTSEGNVDYFNLLRLVSNQIIKAVSCSNYLARSLDCPLDPEVEIDSETFEDDGNPF
jgi:hypothetical protein